MFNDYRVYVFRAEFGGVDRYPKQFRIIAQQTSNAWANVIEQAGRSGPVSLYSIKLIEVQDNIPQPIQDYLRNL